MNCQPVLLVHLQAEDLLNVQQYAEGDLIDGWGGYGHDDGLPLPHECLRNLGAVGGGAQGAVRRVVPSHLVRAIWVWKWKQVLRGDLIPKFKCDPWCVRSFSWLQLELGSGWNSTMVGKFVYASLFDAYGTHRYPFWLRVEVATIVLQPCASPPPSLGCSMTRIRTRRGVLKRSQTQLDMHRPMGRGVFLDIKT